MNKRVKILTAGLGIVSVSAIVIPSVISCTNNKHNNKKATDDSSSNSTPSTNSSTSSPSSSHTSSIPATNSTVTAVFNTLSNFSANDLLTLASNNNINISTLDPTTFLSLCYKYLVVSTMALNVSSPPAIITNWLNIRASLSANINTSNGLNITLSTTLSQQTLNLTYSQTQLNSANTNVNNLPNEIVNYINSNTNYANALIGSLVLAGQISYNSTSNTYSFNYANNAYSTNVNTVLQTFITNNPIITNNINTSLLYTMLLNDLNINSTLTVAFTTSTNSSQLIFKIGINGNYSTDTVTLALNPTTITNFVTAYFNTAATYVQNNNYNQLIASQTSFSAISAQSISTTVFFNNNLQINNYTYSTLTSYDAKYIQTKTANGFSCTISMFDKTYTFDVAYSTSAYKTAISTFFNDFSNIWNTEQDYISYLFIKTYNTSSVMNTNLVNLLNGLNSPLSPNLANYVLEDPTASNITNITQNSNTVSFQLTFNGVTSSTLTLNLKQNLTTSIITKFINNTSYFFNENAGSELTIFSILNTYNTQNNTSISLINSDLAWDNSLTTNTTNFYTLLPMYALFGTFNNLFNLKIDSYTLNTNGSVEIVYGFMGFSNTFILILPNLKTYLSTMSWQTTNLQIVNNTFVNTLMLDNILSKNSTGTWSINSSNLSSFLTNYNAESNTNATITNITINNNQLEIATSFKINNLTQLPISDTSLTNTLTINLNDVTFNPSTFFTNNILPTLKSDTYFNWLSANNDVTTGQSSAYTYVYQYLISVFPWMHQSIISTFLWYKLDPFNVTFTKSTNGYLVINLTYYNNQTYSITTNQLYSNFTL